MAVVAAVLAVRCRFLASHSPLSAAVVQVKRVETRRSRSEQEICCWRRISEHVLTRDLFLRSHRLFQQG